MADTENGDLSERAQQLAKETPRLRNSGPINNDIDRDDAKGPVGGGSADNISWT